jgi:hypothetical protein
VAAKSTRDSNTSAAHARPGYARPSRARRRAGGFPVRTLSQNCFREVNNMASAFLC